MSRRGPRYSPQTSQFLQEAIRLAESIVRVEEAASGHQNSEEWLVSVLSRPLEARVRRFSPLHPEAPDSFLQRPEVILHVVTELVQCVGAPPPSIIRAPEHVPITLSPSRSNWDFLVELTERGAIEPARTASKVVAVVLEAAAEGVREVLRVLAAEPALGAPFVDAVVGTEHLLRRTGAPSLLAPLLAHATSTDAWEAIDRSTVTRRVRQLFSHANVPDSNLLPSSPPLLAEPAEAALALTHALRHRYTHCPPQAKAHLTRAMTHTMSLELVEGARSLLQPMLLEPAPVLVQKYNRFAHRQPTVESDRWGAWRQYAASLDVLWVHRKRGAADSHEPRCGGRMAEQREQGRDICTTLIRLDVLRVGSEEHAGAVEEACEEGMAGLVRACAAVFVSSAARGLWIEQHGAGASGHGETPLIRGVEKLVSLLVRLPNCLLPRPVMEGQLH